MAKKQQKLSPGQNLWSLLYRADLHDKEAGKISVRPDAPKLDAHRSTRRWFEGMARYLKESFRNGLRERREALKLSQQQLAEIAELTVTAVAMIERGERSPNLDTAMRLCWALDRAAGVPIEELQ